MEITVNGKLERLSQSRITISDLLVAQRLAGKRIAVERNGEIVPKSQHSATTLNAGDRIEIVVAVGGG
ncbi:MAG: sulfur carrier protein ThiS [Rhodocyclaceae bacterium]|nr:sulfur carrier protein ThiS [Rhodocyclaceae bacterium]MBP7081138.1 sulfur carrier protein ThiS [Rhodocyclaceae bacterium]